jgi:hypothetical protein
MGVAGDKARTFFEFRVFLIVCVCLAFFSFCLSLLSVSQSV